MSRLSQLRVGATIYYIHNITARHNAMNRIIFLGYQRDGMDMLFTHIPYEEDIFAWIARETLGAHEGSIEPMPELFVLIDGERHAVDLSQARKIETSTMVGAVWCPVANMVAERPYGPGGRETKHGSKHFAPGAKLYCYPGLWYKGYDQIYVVGRHRATHRYVTMIVSSKWLTQWRVKLVHSPHLIRELRPAWDGTEHSHERATKMVEFMNQRVADREQARSQDSDGQD